MSEDTLLVTTRSIRLEMMDLNRPLDPDALRECVHVALQAAHVGALEMGTHGPPSTTSGLRSRLHFVVVTDQRRREALAQLYRRGMGQSLAWRERHFAEVVAEGRATAAGAARLGAATDQLAERIQDVPAHVVPCISWRADGLPVASQAALWGSVFPAVWSFLLAARARGMAGIITTTHLQFEREAAEVLDIPVHEVMQAALVPLASTPESTFRPGPTPPVEAALHWDRW
jgi:nitroreductase